jgi:ABC-type multidrug transport system fused ATPase/permease subunit
MNALFVASQGDMLTRISSDTVLLSTAFFEVSAALRCAVIPPNSTTCTRHTNAHLSHITHRTLAVENACDLHQAYTIQRTPVAQHAPRTRSRSMQRTRYAAHPRSVYAPDRRRSALNAFGGAAILLWISPELTAVSLSAMPLVAVMRLSC